MIIFNYFPVMHLLFLNHDRMGYGKKYEKYLFD